MNTRPAKSSKEKNKMFNDEDRMRAMDFQCRVNDQDDYGLDDMEEEETEERRDKEEEEDEE